MFLFVGLGFVIRVICVEEVYMCKDFVEISILFKFFMDFLNLVKIVRINKDV